MDRAAERPLREVYLEDRQNDGVGKQVYLSTWRMDGPEVRSQRQMESLTGRLSFLQKNRRLISLDSRGFRFPLKTASSPTSPNGPGSAISKSTAMSQQGARSDVSASALSTAGTAEIHPKISMGLDGASTDPSTSRTSTLLDSSRFSINQSAGRESTASALTPASESRPINTQIDEDVPPAKVEEKARSSTIDEAVAKFHEAMGSDARELSDDEDTAPVRTEFQQTRSIREEAGSSPGQEIRFPKDSSNGARELSPKMVQEGLEEDEPNFRRHTPIDVHSKRQVSESVDDESRAAAEVNVMDEIDLN